jgi:hypothetical protein
LFNKKRRKLPIERVSPETHSAPVFVKESRRKFKKFLSLSTSSSHLFSPSFPPFFFAAKRERKEVNCERRKRNHLPMRVLSIPSVCKLRLGGERLLVPPLVSPRHNYAVSRRE